MWMLPLYLHVNQKSDYDYMMNLESVNFEIWILRASPWTQQTSPYFPRREKSLLPKFSGPAWTSKNSSQWAVKYRSLSNMDTAFNKSC